MPSITIFPVVVNLKKRKNRNWGQRRRTYEKRNSL